MLASGMKAAFLYNTLIQLKRIVVMYYIKNFIFFVKKEPFLSAPKGMGFPGLKFIMNALFSES